MTSQASGLVARAAILVLFLASTSFRGAPERRVSVYVSHDQEHSEAILDAFEKQTGIKVDRTFDTEASKTVALVTRIINEASAPIADVYWNNECGQTLRLKDKGLIEPYVSPNAATIPAAYKDPAGYWTGFGARARIIAWNTKSTSEDQVPKRVKDLADPKSMAKGKPVMSKPIAGTALSHVCALYARDGKDATDAWLESLIANGVSFVPGNGPAMRDVAEGRNPFCLTDTDDARGSELSGFPTKVIWPDQGPDDGGLLLIPNTVMLIKGAKHPAEAREFIDYLLSNQVEIALATSRAAQIPLHTGIQVPPNVRSVDSLKVMPVDWAVVGRMIENHVDDLGKRFEHGAKSSAPGAPAGETQTRTATWLLLGVLALAILLIVVRWLNSRREAPV